MQWIFHCQYAHVHENSGMSTVPNRRWISTTSSISFVLLHYGVFLGADKQTTRNLQEQVHVPGRDLHHIQGIPFQSCCGSGYARRHYSISCVSAFASPATYRHSGHLKNVEVFHTLHMECWPRVPYNTGTQLYRTSSCDGRSDGSMARDPSVLCL